VTFGPRPAFGLGADRNIQWTGKATPMDNIARGTDAPRSPIACSGIQGSAVFA